MTDSSAAATLPLEPAAYLPLLEANTAEFTRLLHAGDPDAPVVSCGEWRLVDLGAHLGRVHRWASEIVRTGESCRKEFVRPAGAGLADWYAEGAGALLAELRTADPASECWNPFGTDRMTAFWYRRQAQETVVHLFDAAAAAGAVEPIDPLVAADGVDEALRVFLPYIASRRGGPKPPEPVLLRALDTGHAWLVSPPERDGVDRAVPKARRVEAKDAVNARAEVAAAAEDLLLLLWKRRDAAGARTRITGDTGMAADFLAAPITP